MRDRVAAAGFSGAEGVVAAARWGALACALLLAAAQVHEHAIVVGVVVLFALAAAETTVAPPPRLRLALSLVPAVVVALTGGWSSPLAPCLLPPVLALGLSTGFVQAAALSGATTLIASRLARSTSTLGWLAELVLLAAAAAHARRMEQGAARVADLESANRLLEELHALALHLPMSSDVDDVIASTESRVQALLHADRVAVDLGSSFDGPEPTALLRARGEVVGAVSVVRGAPLTSAERTLLAGVAEQSGLAIDNARRLGQLRTLAVHEERARIARELHDQLGQDLAGLGFLVDGVLSLDCPPDVALQLTELRASVGGVVRRLRDALADLRSDVDEQHDLTDTLSTFLSRVADRSGVATRLESAPSSRAKRLPPVVERELLRIAQEAVHNAERHAQANQVEVRMDGGLLEVSDDGIGLPPLLPDRHYGLIGMRERAEAIGAALEIVSSPGQGTTVRCRLEA
jgi:signal transduction histidine kinase